MSNRNYEYEHNSLDEAFDSMSHGFNLSLAAHAIGFLGGVTGGLVLGHSANHYFDFLRNSPDIIQYTLDFGSACAGGFGGALILGKIAEIYSTRKVMHNLESR